jgi:hypothetical protein
MTSTNNDGNPSLAGSPGHGLENPDEDLFSLAVARARELPATIIETAQNRPLLLAGAGVVIAGAAIGAALVGRPRAPKPVKAVQQVTVGRWTETKNYAELADLIARLARNPLIRQVLLGLVLAQIKKRLH